MASAVGDMADTACTNQRMASCRSVVLRDISSTLRSRKSVAGRFLALHLATEVVEGIRIAEHGLLHGDLEVFDATFLVVLGCFDCIGNLRKRRLLLALRKRTDSTPWRSGPMSLPLRKMTRVVWMFSPMTTKGRSVPGDVHWNSVFG